MTASSPDHPYGKDGVPDPAPHGWEEYDEAIANTAHRVLGRSLRPYCLYYEHFLRVLGSPLVGGADRPATIFDLHLAVRLCGCRYGGVERALRRPGRIRRWAFAVRVMFTDLEREWQRFTDYIEDYDSSPELHPTGGGAEKLPTTGMKIAALMGWGSCTREAA